MKLNHLIKKKSLLLLPLSLLKRFDNIATNSQILYAFLGTYAFFKNKIWKNNFFLLFSFILLFNALIASFIPLEVQWIEYVQLTLLTSLSLYIVSEYSKKDFLYYAIITTCLSALVILANFTIGEVTYTGRIWQINRLPGLVGEPNFSALALTLPIIIFLDQKKWFWFFFSTTQFFFLQSRASLIFFITLIILYGTEKKGSKKIVKVVNVFFLTLLLTSPFLISHVYDSSNNKLNLIKNYSTRFYLTKYYLNLGIEHPFGVGLNNGQSYYKKFGNDFRLEVSKETGLKWIERAEQHSLLNQIISEFGIVTYLFICIYIIFFVQAHFNYLILPILVNLLFINGLNELTLYLGICYCIVCKNFKRE